MTSRSENDDAAQRMLGAVPGTPALGRGPAPNGGFSRHAYHHPAAGWGAARSVSEVIEKAYTFEALQNCELTVQVSTKLNRSHIVHGKRALIAWRAATRTSRPVARRGSPSRTRCRWCTSPTE
jgi:hypothetical protein